MAECVPHCVQSGLEELLVPDLSDLMSTLSAQTGPRFRRLNKAMAGLLDDYSMIGFSALDVSDEESIGEVLMQVREAQQHARSCKHQSAVAAGGTLQHRH